MLILGIALTGSAASVALCKLVKGKFPDIVAFTILTPETIPRISRLKKQMHDFGLSY
jgi:hypothetical protein